METLAGRRAEREARRAREDREELAERIARAAPEDGRFEPLDGLLLRRASAPTEVGHGVSFPAVCVIAQGAKETSLGGVTFRYDVEHYLIATTELPITSRITEASPERPYLGVVLRLEPALVSSVMVEAGQPASREKAAVGSFNVSTLHPDLLNAVLRLVRLLDCPEDAAFVAPLIKREIVYRLLRGEQAERLRQVAVLGGTGHRIVEAIERIRKHVDQPLRIERLARELGMSVSSFHHHFKEVTAMSPLQFQKQLRLQEARRLMLVEGYDATTAGFRVGYDDASHFTREYRRLFGAPPMRDVARLRDARMEPAGL